MKLLFTVFIPFLSLEALRPRWSEPGAYAIIDKGVVVAMSQEALRAGVREGMRSGGVAAIAPGTGFLEREVEKEEAALNAIATALMQYTPEITFQADHSLLLDVSASLSLFKGPRSLCGRIMRSIETIGFTAQLGAAPTAEGAWLLARSYRMKGLPHRRRVLSMNSLHRRLNLLPCSLVPASVPFQDWLTDIGAKRLKGLRQLPRAGLLRRTSKELVAALDRAYGELPEMFEWIKPPLHFSARVETFDRVEHADALLHGATRLILQLVGWLTSLQQSVRAFTLYLEHERGRAAVHPMELEVALAEPVWHEDHLIRLLKERLGKVELQRPVLALRLEAVKIEAMRPQNTYLFPEPGGSPADYARALELVTARIGPENVLVPGHLDDHRPEVCNAWTSAITKPQKHPQTEILEGRPFWMLPKPLKLLVRDERPFYMSSLKIIEGPERVESGWWNDDTVVRDYYVAQAADNTYYWIYRERVPDAPWYLHGMYA